MLEFLTWLGNLIGDILLLLLFFSPIYIPTLIPLIFFIVFRRRLNEMSEEDEEDRKKRKIYRACSIGALIITIFFAAICTYLFFLFSSDIANM